MVEVRTVQDQKIKTTECAIVCLQCLYSESTVNLQCLKQLYLYEMLKLIGFSKDKRYCYAKTSQVFAAAISRIVKGIRN